MDQMITPLTSEWKKGQSTGLTPIFVNRTYFKVLNGSFEEELDLGFKIERRTWTAPESFTVPAGARHQLKCVSEMGTIWQSAPNHKMPTPAQFASAAPFSDSNFLHLGQAHSIDQVEDHLQQIHQDSVTVASPYFMNQLFTGVSAQMLLAEEIIARTRTTLATQEASPLLTEIELRIVESLCEKLGWPTGKRDGLGVPGGSAANLMALHCARHRRFPEIKQEGFSGQKLKVFISEEAHYSFQKAAITLGLGMNQLVFVQVNSDGKMNAQDLEQKIKHCIQEGSTPLMIGATAGTTVLGAFDAIDPLADLAAEYNLWLHVDGAWGGPAVFSSKTKHLLKGVERADSFTFDAHKLLGAGLTCSFFLTKHPKILLDANDVSGGDYLFHDADPSLDRGKSSLQCGRRADAVNFWALWRNLGDHGIGDFIDRLISIRQQSLEWVKRQPRLELIAEPEFLNLCVRVLPPSPEMNIKGWSKVVRNQLKEKNLAFVNYSANDQGTFLRLILAHPFLEFRHIQDILLWALQT